MLFGYDESPADCVNHMLQLRDLQDNSLQQAKGSFQCFVPLPWIKSAHENGQTNLSSSAPAIVKTIAISRLMLDNFNHIKAFWPILGKGLAQIALSFGANDLDGTVKQYHIVNNDRDNAPDHFNEKQIRTLIRQAQRSPVKRNPFYQPIDPPQQ
jgi:aminodeoxyfutalosine synthase